MSTPDRFDLMHEQYLEDWAADNLRHQYEACGIEVPVEAEVQAILRAWENGSDEKPWLDAGQEVKLRLAHPASPGEDESSVTNPLPSLRTNFSPNLEALTTEAAAAADIPFGQYVRIAVTEKLARELGVTPEDLDGAKRPAARRRNYNQRAAKEE